MIEMRMKHPSRTGRGPYADPKIQGRFVTKYGSASDITLESVKTRCAEELALKRCLFSVPSLYESRPDKNQLKLERFCGSIPLWRALLKQNKSNEILHMLGRALGVIHSEYIIPSEYHVTSKMVVFSSDDEVVTLHGDPWLSNFLYTTDEKLVVLDWSSCPWLDTPATVGSRYIDLGILYLSIFTPPRSLLVNRIYKPESFVDVVYNAYSIETHLSEEELYFRTYESICVLKKLYSSSIRGYTFNAAMHRTYASLRHRIAVSNLKRKI